jgi:transposase
MIKVKIKTPKIIETGGRWKMKNALDKKLDMITQATLIVGVDIAKKVQWARFCDHTGREIGRPLRLENNTEGFESLREIIESLRVERSLFRVLVGMESTGHYQRTLIHYLTKHGYTVVGVNPHHTKRAKELDDNSQTKHDQKDALTIARLVKDGRFYESYQPEGCWAELRILTTTRLDVKRQENACKNRIIGVLDEYFPEFETVFKVLTGKTSLHLLKTCPFPTDIIDLGADGVLAEVKKAVKKTVGAKKVGLLIEAAKTSVGVTYGIDAVRLRLRILLSELEICRLRLEEIEIAMEQELEKSGLKERMLSVPGVGIVTLAGFLGETGDLSRFTHGQQIVRLAGFNLTENSSGKSKSQRGISKRGRKTLRSILYQMAVVMAAKNAEMKQVYEHLKNREANPLKRKQALIAIACRIARMLFSIAKHGENYNPARIVVELKAA